MIPFHAVKRAVLIVVAAAAIGCGRPDQSASGAFETIKRFPHDSTAYTQGLLWADSVLYESTGLYGHSDVRRVDLHSGRVLARHTLPADRFGEGLALMHGRLYQLTWESGVAYVYDATTLALIDSAKYPGQGWGLATDGTSLIMSDGSDSLRILSPTTLAVQRVVHVRYKGAPLKQLNELELVDGDLLANVYQTNWILRIDPQTGDVRELLDFANLYPSRSPTAEVMNGIALAPDGHDLLLTGKMWPTLFQVRLRGAPQARP